MSEVICNLDQDVDGGFLVKQAEDKLMMKPDAG